MILLAVFLTITPPQPIDCETVRAKVAEYGRIRALIWAKKNGYSIEAINEARKCLK
jgi:hypothetical protein